MASRAGGPAEDKVWWSEKEVRDNRVQQRLEAYSEAGDEVLLSDHAPPCQETLTLHGKVLWGTSKSSVSELCGEFTLSHLGVLTCALQFKIGVPIYSKFVQNAI